MAVEKTPEECARRVLAVFKQFNVRPDEMLMTGSFITPFNTDGWRSSDLGSGLHYATAQGWVRAEPDRVFLTAAGFAEM